MKLAKQRFDNLIFILLDIQGGYQKGTK